MMRKKQLPILKNARSYLSFLWHRQFLTFLFFLLLSASFWLFQTINEIDDYEYSIPIRLTGVPDNVVVTTEPPSHVRITLRDRGFVLMRYLYTRRFAPITLRWDEISADNGQVSIATADLLKSHLSTLEGNTQIIGTRPETIDFFYNHGQSRELPVVVQGRFETDSAYSLVAVDVEPRNVVVYASKRVLDTLTAAYVEPTRLSHLTDTTTVQRSFVKIPGVKYVPATVKLRIFADRMVEKSVEVPVQGINFPADKTLRTFPSKVKVTFQVGMSQYRKLTAENFVLVVNYEELIKTPGNTCKLSLKTIPYGTRLPRIHPSEVEYIIEEKNETALEDTE
ncbi:YbbR-like domain-containing protein [Alloprevotella sp. OH1205_COT-284]|uniref:CdaR family protein n=1 Tax=Alloprevotella sp. OH1205_COT-284 TaxID=2491043 RepID=UPI000F5F0EB6|nr:YbbR-like domain-containing protein [Alloprevotella sp. OH1205_COT-284]RRD80094.1 YbbR-like domain-containing protein [Alloprevotella sp. OH1205_COT-284]